MLRLPFLLNALMQQVKQKFLNILIEFIARRLSQKKNGKRNTKPNRNCTKDLKTRIFASRFNLRQVRSRDTELLSQFGLRKAIGRAEHFDDVSWMHEPTPGEKGRRAVSRSFSLSPQGRRLHRSTV